METFEHIEVGNGIKISLDSIEGNPYLKVGEDGVLQVALMSDVTELPIPTDTWLSAGEIVAMAGDYYTEAGWAMGLDIPHEYEEQNRQELDQHVLDDEILASEEQAFISAYDNLASPDVTRKKVDNIIEINEKNYIPFSHTLNSYMQQLVLTIRVDDYGKKLDKNEAHFTPWSNRAYVIGHHLALKEARIAKDLHDAADRQENEESVDINPRYFNADQKPSELLRDLAYRYHAMSVAMELFTMHYYSDTFSPGHMSRMSFLRKELPAKFGVWGSILVNSQHNEDNSIGVMVENEVDPDAPPSESVPAQGDGNVDSHSNQKNKENCIKGMTASMADIEKILFGSAKIPVKEFSGLEYLPDIDYDHKQPQPMFVLWKNKIYARDPIQDIHIVSPTEYQNLLCEDPSEHGYNRVKNKWDAFKLVAKLRVLPFIYKGKLVKLSDEERSEIELDEIPYKQMHVTSSTANLLHSFDATSSLRSSGDIEIEMTRPVKRMVLFAAASSREEESSDEVVNGKKVA